MSIEYMSIPDPCGSEKMCAHFIYLPAPFLYIPDQALHASSFVFIKRFVMFLLIGIFYDTKYTGRM